MFIFPDKLVSKKNFLSTSRQNYNHFYCFLFVDLAENQKGKGNERITEDLSAFSSQSPLGSSK